MANISLFLSSALRPRRLSLGGIDLRRMRQNVLQPGTERLQLYGGRRQRRGSQRGLGGRQGLGVGRSSGGTGGRLRPPAFDPWRRREPPIVYPQGEKASALAAFIPWVLISNVEAFCSLHPGQGKLETYHCLPTPGGGGGSLSTLVKPVSHSQKKTNHSLPPPPGGSDHSKFWPLSQ
jgi:hypothetical protein